MGMWTIGAECVTKEFVVKDDHLDLYFRGTYPYAGYQGVGGKMYYCEEEGMKGDPTCYATMGSHHCKWAKKKSHKIPFNILDTDYENYEIYYDCHNIFFGWFHWSDFAVSGRTPKMSEDLTEKVRARVKELLPTYNVDKQGHFTL